MNKIIITLMAIYFLGDPDLQYLLVAGRPEALRHRRRALAGLDALDRQTARRLIPSP